MSTGILKRLLAADGHLCAYRAIFTLLARQLHQEHIDPDNRAAMQRLKLEVARMTDHA